MKIKVCGLTAVDNAAEIISLGPSWIGCNFFPPSPRYISPEKARSIECPRSQKVGVFVNESFPDIVKIAESSHLGWVQLHGDESPNLCEKLRFSGLKVIKAINVEDQKSIDRAEKFGNVVDLLLFDAPRSDAGEYGGTGSLLPFQNLSWRLTTVPFLLAGGLDESIILSLLSLNAPSLVGFDINSKFEIVPGIKDRRKVFSLLTRLKNI